MSFDAIVQDLTKTQGQLADIRQRLLAEKKKHTDAIKAIDTVLASVPAPKTAKAPSEPKPAAVGGPSIGEAIVGLVKSAPGATISEIVTGLPGMKRKSVENTASRLVSEGKLTRDGKGYAVAS